MVQTVKSNPFEEKVVIQNLRRCQDEAYKETSSHFGTDSAERHVLLQLPTGTGKSVIAGILPFGLAKGKVLVIAPGLRLLEQLVKDLDLRKETNKYDELKLFSESTLGKLRNELFLLELSSSANAGDVLDNQIIVTNFHKLQDVAAWFSECREEIDLIIIDEAHHQNAATYQEVIKYFSKSKIVGLTGTPFRSDGQRVEGKRIYKYSYEDAIRDKIIRNFHHHDVTPEEVELTFEDESQRIYTLSQILEMSEDSWFQQQISMSDDCCYSIALKAKEKLQDLRKKFPQERHQIIASAMSVRHARVQVQNAFKKAGLTVGLVSSHKEEAAHNKKVFEKLERGDIDVIIHVGMLGEGFDHKPLGVAAIFRPYKSLNPYIQFVGRVIRKNGSTGYSYVISHAGLNQVSRFREFKLFDKDDQEFLQNHLFTDPEQPKGGREESFVDNDYDSKPETAMVRESGGLIEIGHSFVQMSKIDDILKRLGDLSEAEVDVLRSKLETDPDLMTKTAKLLPHPTDQRKASRINLNESAKSIATDIAAELGLKKPLHSRTMNKMCTDFAWIMRRVNKYMSEQCKLAGVPEDRAKDRKNLRNDDYDKIEQADVVGRAREQSLTWFRAKAVHKTAE
jgi:DNA repair protein RadD